MPLSDLTREAVESAIAEFNRLHREKFLKKYGFGRARDYLLSKDGRVYDSKAIAGAAHGYLPGQKPLRFDEFSGGEATVKRALEGLGFEVLGPTDEKLPTSGEVLTNEDIARRFAVGSMGGMRRSTKLNALVLISDPFKGLYQDRWEEDVLHYTGMGPVGDQSLTYAQNRTLAEARKSGIAVHLLEAFEPQRYTYIGQVQLVEGPYFERQIDSSGALRKVWMFPLRIVASGAHPAITAEQAREIERAQARMAQRLSTEELRARALRGRTKPVTRIAQTSAYVRDPAVAEYVKRVAKGFCDLCENPAPFRTKRDEAYLECHHINWLAKGGEDTVANTVALCPNCHRKMHVVNHAKDREKLVRRATQRVA